MITVPNGNMTVLTNVRNVMKDTGYMLITAINMKDQSSIAIIGLVNTNVKVVRLDTLSVIIDVTPVLLENGLPPQLVEDLLGEVLGVDLLGEVLTLLEVVLTLLEELLIPKNLLLKSLLQ